MVLYPNLLSQSWSTTVPSFMLVSGIAQSAQNLALSRLAMSTHALLNLLNELRKIDKMRVVNLYCDMSLSKGHLGSRGGGGEGKHLKLN